MKGSGEENFVFVVIGLFGDKTGWGKKHVSAAMARPGECGNWGTYNGNEEFSLASVVDTSQAPSVLFAEVVRVASLRRDNLSTRL